MVNYYIQNSIILSDIRGLNIYWYKSNFPPKWCNQKWKNGWNGRLRWIKKGHRKGGWLFWQRCAHMWPSFAYVASLQGKGPRKHKQQRSCSWSREAVACLRDLRTVNNGWSDAQDFGTATDACCNSEAIAFLRLHLHSVNIYPTGKHASFHSFCTETTVELPPSQRNDVKPERTTLSGPGILLWMLGIKSRIHGYS